MMKKEELVSIGLDDNQIQEVFKLNGKAVENVREQLTSVQSEAELYKSKIADLESNLETVVKPEDYEEIKSTKEALELQLNDLKVEYEEKISKINFDNTLDNKLREAGARSLRAVKALINQDTLKYEDGEINGLTEEIERLKANYDYQFIDNTSEPSKPKFTQKKEQNNNKDLNPFALRAAKYKR